MLWRLKTGIKNNIIIIMATHTRTANTSLTCMTQCARRIFRTHVLLRSSSSSSFIIHEPSPPPPTFHCLLSRVLLPTLLLLPWELAPSTLIIFFSPQMLKFSELFLKEKEFVEGGKEKKKGGGGWIFENIPF